MTALDETDGTADQTRKSATAILADGTHAIAWVVDDAVYQGVRVCLIPRFGAVERTEFLIDAINLNASKAPELLALPDGRFIVVWNEFNDDATTRIMAQLFDPSGLDSGFAIEVDPAAREIRLPDFTLSWPILAA